MDDMPSGHLDTLFGYWPDDMPSGHPDSFGHFGLLGHLGHLGHLGYLGTIGNLDPLDPYPLDPALTDSLPGAFITEMDPMDPGLSEGCYADDSLDPIPTDTPLLPQCLDRHYTSQILARSWSSHTSQTDGQVLGTSDFPIDTLNGHGSLSEIHR
jgi:hypothetical protein